jgi:diacylglycerol kinase
MTSKQPEEANGAPAKKPKQSLLRSFGCAFVGIATVIGKERNIKIQLGIALLAVLIGIFLALTPLEWCVVVILIALVLAAEMINSALEGVIDIICPKLDERARQVKDAAAGAVLLLALSAVICAAIIYFQAAARLLGAAGA